MGTSGSLGCYVVVGTSGSQGGWDWKKGDERMDYRGYSRILRRLMDCRQYFRFWDYLDLEGTDEGIDS